MKTLIENKMDCHVASLLAMTKKSAFTLAEVLITLGIIGVVAAMTIPNLVTNYQKRQTVTKLQKALAVLNQAYRQSYDDLGEPSPNEVVEMGKEKYFSVYWAPYIKSAQICKSYTDCGYKTDRWYNLDGINNIGITSTDNSRIAFYAQDGIFYQIMFSSGNNNTPNSYIIVDINGAAGPNIFGKDVFVSHRLQDGKGIALYCNDKSDTYVNNDCSSSVSGTCCAEKIRRDGWVIGKDYPW